MMKTGMARYRWIYRTGISTREQETDPSELRTFHSTRLSTRRPMSCSLWGIDSAQTANCDWSSRLMTASLESSTSGSVRGLTPYSSTLSSWIAHD